MLRLQAKKLMNTNAAHEYQVLLKNQYEFSVVIRTQHSRDFKTIYCSSKLTDFEILAKMLIYRILYYVIYRILYYVFEDFSRNNRIRV